MLSGALSPQTAGPGSVVVNSTLGGPLVQITMGNGNITTPELIGYTSWQPHQAIYLITVALLPDPGNAGQTLIQASGCWSIVSEH